MIRSYKVRVDVLRKGSRLTSLSAASAPTVDCISTAPIPISMSCRFYDDNNLINWLTDELVPIQVIDGVEYPVGVFPISTAKKAVDANGTTVVEVEAYDRCLILHQSRTESILHLVKGTNYIDAIETLLVQAGIRNRIAEPTEAVLASDREDWPIGTTLLEIINQLLSEINYQPIYFDHRGFAILEPYRDPTVESIDHRYGGDDLKVLEWPLEQETDIFSRANVFIAVCDNPDLPDALIARAENTNPLSSLSIDKRGRRIAEVVKVDNIPSQRELDEYAHRLAIESMMVSEEITIGTINMPGHGVYDTVSIIHPRLSALCQEVEWHLIMEPGETMTHKLRRSILV